MFEGFLSLGGSEVINTSRTAAYVEHMLPQFGLDNCYDCGDLQHALGHEDYTSPLVDGADWLDANDVRSQGFFGLYPLSIEGIDDAVRESTVTQLAGDGAVMSAPRQRGREIRVTGLLIGLDDAAIAYGLAWLRSALMGGACRDSTSCTGDHLCYFSSCPPICEDSPDVTHPFMHQQRLCDEGIVTSVARACALPYERNLYEVTVIDGPRVMQRYNTICGSMVRVEFTMVAGVPWSYSTASWVASSDEGQPSMIVPEISCAAGTTTVLRSNLATNPVPMNAGGWTSADPGAYTVTRDTAFSRLPGRASARVTVTNAEAAANIATNPVPGTSLTGWAYEAGGPPANQRRNSVLNPRAVAGAGGSGWSFQAGVNEVGTTSLVAGASDGPLLPDGTRPATYTRRTITTGKTSGSSGFYYRGDPGSQVLPVGATHAGSMYVRSSVTTQVTLIVQDRAGSSVGSGTGGGTVDLPAGVWVRLGAVDTVTLAGADGFQVWAVHYAGEANTPSTIDAVCAMAEPGATVVGPYFDGATPSVAPITRAWTGTANSSASTETVAAPAATTTANTGAGPGGVAGFMRSIITIPKTGGYSGPYYTMNTTSSPIYTAAIWVRSSADTVARLLLQGRDTDGLVVVAADTDFTALPANTWVRLGPATIESLDVASVRVRVQQAPDTILGAGTALDVTQVVIAASPTLGSTSMGRVHYVGQATTSTTIALAAGAAYTASIYVATSRVSNARLQLRFKNTAGTVLETATSAWHHTPVGTWSRVEVTGTAPAGTTLGTVEAYSDLRNDDAEVGDSTWWGDILLERASVALAYFDGSLTDRPPINYGWTGTAHASISTLSRSIAYDPGPVLDPDCAIIPQAPRPPVLDIACLDTPAMWRRFVAILPEDVVPMWRDAVPIVRVATDAAAARQVRVRFYANPFEVAVEALDPCDFCGEFIISYIPPNSIMTIDGIRQSATVSGPSGVVQVASHLLYSSDGGPMVWPLLTCGISYTVTLDVSPEGVTGLSADLCAAARE